MQTDLIGRRICLTEFKEGQSLAVRTSGIVRAMAKNHGSGWSFLLEGEGGLLTEVHYYRYSGGHSTLTILGT